MPTGAYSLHPWDMDARRWARCRRAAEAEVKARGIFDSHRRYHDLVTRGALKRFAVRA